MIPLLLPALFRGFGLLLCHFVSHLAVVTAMEVATTCAAAVLPTRLYNCGLDCGTEAYVATG